MKLLQRVLSLKVHQPICAVVHAVMLKQEALKKLYIVRGETNKWRQAPVIV